MPDFGKIKILYQEPLAGYTTWGIGGPAQILAFPERVEDIQSLADYAVKEGLPLNILGGGSNVLIPDQGVPGLVICLRKGFNNYKFEGNCLTAQAGTSLVELVQSVLYNGLSGMEMLAGIPGTLGGAIRGNAGTKEGSIGQLIGNVTIWVKGKILTLTQSEIGFGYRKTELPQGSIILDGRLKLAPAPAEQIRERMRELMAYRRQHQPLGEKSAGCVFKNPIEPGHPATGPGAGALIEQAELKGVCVGDAMVSPKHANFIVNCGKATASQVLTLIALIQDKVWQVHNIRLELEVSILG